MAGIVSINLSSDAFVSRCWDSIVGRQHYVSKLQKNLLALTTSLEELKCIKNDVKRKVEVVEQQPHMKRLDQVQGWIVRVETMETQVNEVLNDRIQETEKLCCGGWCSKNYISSYKYGKKVVKKLLEVTALKEAGVFQEVAERLPAPLVSQRPIEPIVGMESMFDKVWSHIEDEEVGVIGLYGMGGVGKTTLLTKINNNFLHSTNDFNLVIWIVVSKDFKLDNIQNKIGEKIGFSDETWKRQGQDEKAEDISMVLGTKKFVLFLDDMWERVEITKVGVPFPDKQNKCKVLFTTRSEDVCGLMDAHVKIKVECLASEKAWTLFQQKVGKETLLVHRDIPRLAEVVAKECGGLPLALITVGRAMACKKTPEEWDHAIQVLKKSASEFSGMEDKVLRLLKFSYDSLPSEKVRSCFLYCALFPEDFLIPKDTLLNCWMAEEMWDEHANVHEGRSESYHIIGVLLNVCLLEEYKGNFVKMHDVIRDMALWLACDPAKTNESFLVHASADLIEAPNVGKWKSMKRISLMSNRMEHLVETPNSPSLLTLFLGGNNLKKIDDGFFDHMPSLKVLDLSDNKDLTRLPCGVSNLVSLQHLNLSETGIKELSEEIKNLSKLKYLNLEFTGKLDSVPPNLISSFPMLKVLRMFKCGSSDKILFEGEISMIEELQGLKHFDVLTLSIRSTACFYKFLKYYRLQTCTETLLLMDQKNRSSFLDLTSLLDMKNLDLLQISEYPNLEEIGIDWAGATNDPRNSIMKNQSRYIALQHVSVSSCFQLNDVTWLVFAQNLISLYVYGCSGMREIISSQRLGANVVKNMKPFAKLSVLDLWGLPLLSSIYRSALPFPYLSEIRISGCPALRELPLNSSSARGCNLIIQGEEWWWNRLQWPNEDARNAFLPCFKRLSSNQGLP
ncbi:putative disease resistance protein [Rosa sericea]